MKCLLREGIIQEKMGLRVVRLGEQGGSTLFSPDKHTSLNMITQGPIGDCFLVSAVIALWSYHPSLITRLFGQQSVNPQGVFAVWLNQDGEWKRTIIDDYVLTQVTTLHSLQVLCSRSAPGELWLTLLEKAYAKMRGGYHLIDGGSPAVAL